MSENSNKTQETRAKPLSASEIRRITQQSQSGFPAWALDQYGKTHVLRWISQSKIYSDNQQVDSRGYELIKDPKTGKTARWNEMLLGAMPNEIAKDRREAISKEREAAAGFIKEKIESAQDRLRYELAKQGYDTQDRKKFKYEIETK